MKYGQGTNQVSVIAGFPLLPDSLLAEHFNKEIKSRNSGPKVIFLYTGISVTVGSVIAKFYYMQVLILLWVRKFRALALTIIGRNHWPHVAVG